MKQIKLILIGLGLSVALNASPAAPRQQVVCNAGPQHNSQTCSWLTLDDAETGSAQEMASNPDKSVHATGTWDGATLVVQGSNDNADWVGLTDYDGNAISCTDDCLVGVRENVRYIRPVTSGGGTTSINVHIHASGGQQ